MTALKYAPVCSILQKAAADTCVVHRKESLLHEHILQILVIHWDFSHHVAWHVTRETTRLTMIETIRVLVSQHLIHVETERHRHVYDSILGFGGTLIHVCACLSCCSIKEFVKRGQITSLRLQMGQEIEGKRVIWHMLSRPDFNRK